MRRFFYIAVFIFNSANTFAQDIHFSQYYSAPLTVNPAQTGLFDGTYRAGINYRNQWASVTVPYQTTSAFADCNLRKQPYNKAYLGIGLLVIRDQAGDGELSNTKVFGSVAYHIVLNKLRTMQLSFGTQGGVVEESINFSKLYFDDQWADVGFNQAIQSGEPFASNAIHYLDANMGTMYSFILPNTWSCYAGVSVYNLLQPKVSFYNEQNDLGLRPIVQGGISIDIGKNYVISPSGIDMLEKGANEILLGSMASYSPSPYSQNDQKLYLGAYLRTGDAAIAVLGYEVNHVRFLFSYDFNYSQLEPASQTEGAFEVSLIYIGSIFKGIEQITLPCPRF
jgi:type IX secretion system PorP/SprF family membrane protein